MKYYLARDASLKWLETPSVYQIVKDELYELDDISFGFLKDCASPSGCSTDDTEFIDYCLSEGILTREVISLNRPPLIKSPEPSLRYLELQITERCNFSCKHCFLGTHTPPATHLVGGLSNQSLSELSLSQITAILKEFEEMQGLRVLITGGEPLLHRQFEEINERLPDFFIRKVLFTNGSLLGKKVLKRLHVNEIQISIDGLEHAHDALRGKGTYRLAIDAVKRVIDSGFEVSVSTMVHAKNLEDFDEMDRLFKRLGIKDWTVDIPCITGNLIEHKDFHISPQLGGKYFRYGYGEGLHTSTAGFGCGLHLAAVMADGRVAKCTFYAERPVGYIKEGLRACWERIQPIRLDNLACDCSHIESCRGGCRYRAELLGDPLGKDLYKCSFYGVY
jgi:radical SAM protein with 4Fe4S-binding SPASM domain